MLFIDVIAKQNFFAFVILMCKFATPLLIMVLIIFNIESSFCLYFWRKQWYNSIQKFEEKRYHGFYRNIKHNIFLIIIRIGKSAY